MMEILIPLPADEVWTLVGNLRHFACIDPFHQRILVLGPELKPGVELAIQHGALGISWVRFGRLLYWREGEGYAFSDLSPRGPGRGFPHVFTVEVSPAGPGEARRARLTIHVRGRWTAHWLPRWVRQLWLQSVCTAHLRLLRLALKESLL
jgi:hypothetical protein